MIKGFKRKLSGNLNTAMVELKQLRRDAVSEAINMYQEFKRII